MYEINEYAFVRICFSINNDKYDVKHSLYKHSLISVMCNGSVFTKTLKYAELETLK